MADYPPLATAADLAKYNIDTSDTELVDELLDSVSAAIRDAAGVPITRETSEVTLPGVCNEFLQLPGGPVRSVASVLVDGTVVTDYKIRDGRLWRRRGWGNVSTDVEVTYTHGYDEVPADIVKLTCTLVAAGINEATSEDGPASRRGLASWSEGVDDYRVQETYTRGRDEVVDVTSIPERTREWLRARFGSLAAVTGGY